MDLIVEVLQAELQGELTVHVVTVCCAWPLAEEMVKNMWTWARGEVINLSGVGLECPLEFPEEGGKFCVDEGVWLILRGRVRMIVLLDDAICGGATITSRWTSP